MAHLKTKATTGKLPEREQWKWRLIRGLYEKEFEREQIIKLFEIIDNMMTLSPELQSSLESKIKQFEEERTMPLMSNMELRGMERGKEIGKEIGELRGMERGKEIGKEIGVLEKSRDAIKTVLTVRFGEISSEIEEIIAKMTNPTILEELLKLAATANSLAEFRQSLARIQ
ncbi:hypothetical protein MTo_03702 [Microcystis aeruginosa NIES-1211]|uniref:hypothetical protein n=1 Tax=Microcystis aeruginosa TaxID=1126 RepID=UPI000D7C2600|nr:hypothetical protein MTo_03702 [Microcystis aeruginosa NIES-1211]